MSADFQERMAIGKANAMRDRERGGSTVRVYATTNEMLHSLGRIESDNFDRWLVEVAARVSEIVEQSRFAIYGERDRWADINIPF